MKTSKLHSLYLFLALGLTTTFFLDVQAAPLCRAALQQKIYTVADLLDQKKLAKTKFAVNSSQQLVDTAHGNVVIGSLRVLTPPQLYEWAPQDFHEAWVQNGGISASEMRGILKEQPQAAGRGYYVSTSPHDSTGYGDALTVFDTQGPLLVIDSNPTINMSSPEFMMRMQSAGVDAVRVQSSNTWLSIINAKHLTISSKEILDPIWSDVSVWKSLLSRFTNLQSSGVVQRLPESNILKVIFNISTDRKFKISKEAADSLFELDLTSLKSRGVEDAILDKVVVALLKYKQADLEANLSKENLREFLDLAGLNPKAVAQVLAKNLNSKNRDLYSQITRFVDIKTLAYLAQGEGIKELESWDKLKRKMSTNIERRKRIKITPKSNYDDFLSFSGQLLGKEVAFRNEDYMMAPDLSEDKSLSLRLKNSVLNRLTQNSFLSVEIRDTQPEKGTVDAEVTYLSLERIKLLIDELPVSASLQRQVKALQLPKAGVEFEAQAKKVYKMVLKELVKNLFSSPEAQNKLVRLMNPNKRTYSVVTAIDLYQVFMSIHPFEDGNGRSGRLFYEFMNQESLIQTPMELPIYDLDIFVNSQDLATYMAFFQSAKLYLSMAKDDTDFLQRSKVLLKYLISQYPGVLDIFPELATDFQ